MDSHYAYDSHTTEQDISNSTEHDLTALRAKLTTPPESLDQRELGLATRQDRIEGTDEGVREPEEEMEKRSSQLGGLNASTSALSLNSWPITLLRSVVFPVLGNKTSSFLFCSCSFLHYHPLLLKPPSKKTLTRPGNPTRSIPRPCWHWRVRCCVEGACEEVDWGWVVELVGEEEQEVTSVGYTFWIWFQA